MFNIWNTKKVKPKSNTSIVIKGSEINIVAYFYRDKLCINDISCTMEQKWDEVSDDIQWAYLDDLVKCSLDFENVVKIFLREKPEFEDWIDKNFF